jgi:hypothetical protein
MLICAERYISPDSRRLRLLLATFVRPEIISTDALNRRSEISACTG